MTLKEAYEYGQQQLNKAHIAEATLDAWYLLEFVTGISRTKYFLCMQEEMSQEQEETYRNHIATRATHIPLQHITGVQEFMGLEFEVNSHVLIPRQDTEVLVEEVMKIVEPDMEILDMCTGSGCILISLLKLGKNGRGMGVDISGEALAVAKANAKRHGVHATFLQSDLFARVTETYDIIVSNPPYIPTKVIEELAEEVKFHDPYLALDGKEDGLFFYRSIVKESPNYLKKNGKLYFEIGHDQGEAVVQLMKDAGFTDVTLKKDLAGLDRVVFGVYSEKDDRNLEGKTCLTN